MPAKRKRNPPSEDVVLEKKPRGRPPKAKKKKVDESPPAPAPAATSTNARSSSRSTTVTSTDSDVVPGTTLESESSTPSSLPPLDDDDEVQIATEGLLGRDGKSKSGKSKAIESEQEDSNDEDEEMEDVLEDEEEEEEVDGAADELSITSSTTSTEFFRTIADGMDVRVWDLKIAYRFSTWKVRTLPRKLETEKQMEKMFENAKAELVDLTEKQAKGEKKADAKGKGKNKQSSKKRDQSDSDGEDGDPKRKSGADCLRELEDQHKCQTHTGFCFVAKDGEHVALSTQKLSLWSLLMAQGAHESKTMPPEALNLNLDGSKAKPVARRSQPIPESGPYPHYSYPPGGHPPPFYPPYYAPPPPMAAPAPVAVTEQQPRASTLRHGASTESHDDYPPTLYPKISDWVLELDMGDRGEDGHQFTSFGTRLESAGYKRISQLVDLADKGVEVLQRICNDMPEGTAQVILKYARQDCKMLRKINREERAAWDAK
ncbi:hypothetical protein DFH06DRAFT_401232 [Mycena polygramma]|nr:hypothetical protein DFH06DRAFT_401232 [Mycena polygramma]